VLRDQEDGLAIAPHGYTVADAVTDWLTYGLSGRSANTITKNRHLCHGHILPDLGARKLRDLSAEDVDRWLASKAGTLSSATVQNLYSCLNRPHPPNVYQDGEQVVIRGPGYLTMTGSLAVPVELEHSPPESIDVALRFRPIGGKRDKSHKLTLMQLKPAEEKTRRVEFRAQWGWRAIAPR
jgi:hypothetical protein